MTKLPLESAVLLAELFVFAVGTTVLSTVGIYLELLAIDAVTAGQLTLGLWLCLWGGLALYFGVYAMGVTELLPRLRKLRPRASTRPPARR